MTNHPKELEHTRPHGWCCCLFSRRSKHSTQANSLTENKAVTSIITPAEKIPILDDLTLSVQRTRKISGKTLYADIEGELTEPMDDATPRIIN